MARKQAPSQRASSCDEPLYTSLGCPCPSPWDDADALGSSASTDDWLIDLEPSLPASPTSRHASKHASKHANRHYHGSRHRHRHRHQRSHQHQHQHQPTHTDRSSSASLLPEYGENYSCLGFGGVGFCGPAGWQLPSKRRDSLVDRSPALSEWSLEVGEAMHDTMEEFSFAMHTLMDHSGEAVSLTVGEVRDAVSKEIRWCRRIWGKRKRQLRRTLRKGRKRYLSANQPAASLARFLCIAGIAIYVALQLFLLNGSCTKSFLERAAFGLAWPAGYYCGPANGQEYAKTPRDTLDAICAQHDFCIENTRFPSADGQSSTLLYPKGFYDGDARSQRCGMKFGSWKNEGWGELIMQCDMQLVDSIANGFRCHPSLPRSSFCLDTSFLGQAACKNHYDWFHPLYLPCRFAALGIRHFESQKIRRTNATLAI